MHRGEPLHPAQRRAIDSIGFIAGQLRRLDDPIDAIRRHAGSDTTQATRARIDLTPRHVALPGVDQQP
ncbi:hypothetical protein [Burkholderia ubonensis]|uniref:hypothetical protein n=1 Tax=Burkholderia ubonensis TaxID=101571 RepID=UPI000751D4B5|nr:hypothetical protein [Burkholderia ubonensis]KVN33259.1 hypothetical protein WJ64_11080 [Burkholderia ubonensis]